MEQKLNLIVRITKGHNSNKANPTTPNFSIRLALQDGP